MLSGSMVALVTPFLDGRIDKKALEGLIEFHLKEGTDAIVPCGTTGESATLSHEEHKEVIKFVVEVVGGRIPVIAGAGSNCTEEGVELARYAESVGADGILVITPYYNKPTQRGLYEHFKTVANEVSIPVVLYNVPSRTGVNLEPETVFKLTEIENIKAIKEASGDLKQQSKLMQLCRERITLLSGDDFTLLPTLSIGGKGVISVVANVMPRKIKELITAFNSSDIKKAYEIHLELYPLIEAMFYETNPVPVKEALSLMNMCRSEVRLPLVPLSKENKERLKKVLTDLGIIS